MPLGARLWHYTAELCNLSVKYPLFGLALTSTTDNQSENFIFLLKKFSEKCRLDVVFIDFLDFRSDLCVDFPVSARPR